MICTKSDFVVLDTETTGLGNDARVCEISIIDMSGDVLLDTLINPEIQIPADAIAIHGITNEMVKVAPTISSIFSDIQNFLSGKVLAVYNVEYDVRLLNQSLLSSEWDTSIHHFCVMQSYAEYYGHLNSFGDYKWQRLTNACFQQGIDISVFLAHRSLSDCQMTLALMNEFMCLAD